MAEILGNYTFLPWYRTGLGALVTSSGADRAVSNVTIVADASGAPLQATRPVQLMGPGDVVGIDTCAIVRLEPRPFANDFESNYLAAIEFFDEDYPWRYSPRAPEAGGTRVLPWLALVVLEEGEFALGEQGRGRPRVLKVKSTASLPPPDQAWAWAHAHLSGVNANVDDKPGTANQIAENPAQSCSRILAARHLGPLKAYRAFLVPVFETGRVAALQGATAHAGPLAWEGVASIDLPIYFEWTFRTGEGGSFKELAEALTPHIPEANVGRRPVDMSHPLENVTLPAIENGEIPARPVLDLESALRVPGAQPTRWLEPSKGRFQTAVADLLNLSSAWKIDASKRLKNQPALPQGIALPVVTPPIYGQHHANLDAVDPARAAARWLEQLNLDPRNRAAAAFGTLVVQKNQEDFMA
jgi:hypothetical protein